MLTQLSIIAASIFAAIAIVSPRDGDTVRLLKPEQRAYLGMSRSARHQALGKPEVRSSLAAVGGSPKPVRLVWQGSDDHPYDVTIADEEGNDEVSMTVANATNVYVTNLLPGRRYHWMVSAADGYAAASFVTADEVPRALVAPGLSNFRDLGGWKTEDGKRVRFCRIYRSAGLRNSSKSRGDTLVGGKVTVGSRRVTENAIAQLTEEFHIKTDVELRTRQECMGFSDTLIDGAKWVHVPFVAYDLVDNLIRGKEPFAKLFRVFADEKNYPILVHCSGGRDRTGTIAFILNGVLGVPEGDLLRDWEFSAFSDSSVKFNASRIERLQAYLNGLPGKTLKERTTFFVQSCGVTDDEIESFRKIMLTEAK